MNARICAPQERLQVLSAVKTQALQNVLQVDFRPIPFQLLHTDDRQKTNVNFDDCIEIYRILKYTVKIRFVILDKLKNVKQIIN